MSENEAFLSRILVFPVKALDALELEQARVLSSGALEHDRTWGLFDSSGKFVNGKRYAAVHRLRSHFDLKERVLTLRDENGRGLGSRTFSVDQDGEALESCCETISDFRSPSARIQMSAFPMTPTLRARPS